MPYNQEEDLCVGAGGISRRYFHGSWPSLCESGRQEWRLVRMVETLTSEYTWRCLWSHAAHDIISSLPSTASWESIQVGFGWGLRDRANHRRALLLHPSGNGRETG